MRTQPVRTRVWPSKVRSSSAFTSAILSFLRNLETLWSAEGRVAAQKRRRREEKGGGGLGRREGGLDVVCSER